MPGEPFETFPSDFLALRLAVGVHSNFVIDNRGMSEFELFLSSLVVVNRWCATTMPPEGEWYEH